MRAIWAIGLWLLVAPAQGGELEAERYRLSDEMLKLAQKNAWTGVERAYLQLEELGLPLELEDHLVGGQSAMESGDMLTALTRLQVGLAVAVADDDPNSRFQQGKGMVDTLQERYGMVHVVIYDEKVVPVLFRNPMPFSAQERQAIAYARTRIAESRAFMGLLPVGTYQLDQSDIVVVSRAPMVEVRIPE